MRQNLEILQKQLDAVTQSSTARFAWTPQHIADLAEFLELNDLKRAAYQLRDVRETLIDELTEMGMLSEK